MATTPRSAKASTTATRRRRPAPRQDADERAIRQEIRNNGTGGAPKRTAKRAEPQVPTERPVEGYTVDLQDPGSETERKWENLLEKDPNENHREFQAWFEEQTGKSLDLKTIQFTLATWHEFQRSPEHRERTQQKRAAAAEKRAQAEKARVERALKAAKAAGLEVVEA